jgi:ketosteroid isomerase-like protein
VAENTSPPPAVVPPAAPRPTPAESAAAPAAGARSDAPREPAAPPRPQVPDDETQIRAVLAAYAQGYRNLDVNSILRVYPKAPAAELRKGFDEAREYDVQIDVSQVRVTGDRATVTSRVRQSFRPKAGRALETTNATQFDLQRSGGGWVIVNRR